MLLTELLDMFKLDVEVTRDEGLWYAKVPSITSPSGSLVCTAYGSTPHAALNKIGRAHV